MRARKVLAALGVVAVLLGGALLRGWLVPAGRGDLAPEAYNWRLRLPWAPRAAVTLFFPTPDGAALVAVRRTVAEATPLVVLQELAAGPSPESGLGPALPPGVLVDTVAVADGVATVHASGATLGDGDLAAMARTLAGQATALRVVLASGQTLGPVEVPAAPTPGGQVTYLWRGLPVPAAAPAVAGDPSGAVRRLLEGMPPAGIEAMPGDVRLAGLDVRGDTARVSLELSPGVIAELTAGRWQFAPHAMAIVYTLTDQPGIRRVQFDFPNLPPEARRNCKTPLGVPLVRPDPEPARAKGA
jgi:spore germination protein GerM